jgi:hypothetical protein
VPAYRPWFWYPPPVWGYPPYYGGVLAVGFVWGAAWAVSVNNWGWCHPNWHSGHVNINISNNNIWVNRPQYREAYRNNGNWNHQIEHRRGVAYRDSATGERYRPSNRAGVQTRENYRGRDAMARPAVEGGGNEARPAARPPGNEARAPAHGPRASAPGTRPAPAYRPESRPQVQHEAERGAQSRAAMQRPAPGSGHAGAARTPGRGR